MEAHWARLKDTKFTNKLDVNYVQGLFICVWMSFCTNAAHDKESNGSDNLLSHHCSNVVYWAVVNYRPLI